MILTETVIENVTVVTPGSWWNLVVSFGSAALAALVSWLIYRGNSKRADKLAAIERQGHQEELGRLKEESDTSAKRHEEQIAAMREQVMAMRDQSRRKREIKFLTEASDFLLELTMMDFETSRTRTPRTVLKLRQFSGRLTADFAEDDPAFAVHVSYFFDDLARRVEVNAAEEDDDVASVAAELIILDASIATTSLLQWLTIPVRTEATERFADYPKYGNLFGTEQYGAPKGFGRGHSSDD